MRLNDYGQDIPVAPWEYDTPLGPPAAGGGGGGTSFWDELSAAAGKLVQAGGAAGASAIYKASGTRPPNTQPVVAKASTIGGLPMNTVLLVGGIGLAAFLLLGRRR